MNYLYYESNKKKSFSIEMAVIIIILIFIIILLFYLMNLLERNKDINKEETKLTGTDTVLTEFNIKDLANNSGYSIVRSFKNK